MPYVISFVKAVQIPDAEQYIEQLKAWPVERLKAERANEKYLPV
jgi:hypothetical protein